MEELLDKLADLVAEKLAEKLGAPTHRELWTVEELCERYGLSPDAIRRRIRAGEFGETVNVGGRSHRVTAAGVRHYDETHMGPAYQRR